VKELTFLPPRVLTIAGSDSGGGAGIEADIKTFAALGVHGLVALTAITAQNTTGVLGTIEVSPEMIRCQIDAVASDIGVDMAKTGMLYSSPIVEEVVSAIERHRIRLVVDPVMVSKSGDSLLQRSALRTLIEKLLPLAEAVTPNLSEAEALSRIKIASVEDSKVAGQRILDLGPKAVIVKGGHLPGSPVDVLCLKGQAPREYTAERINVTSTHGTGCTFSSALASYLALGDTLEESVKKARDFVRTAITYGLAIGKGVGPVDPTAGLRADAERFKTISMMEEALSIIESSHSLAILAPECQINIVMALPKPFSKGVESVCGVPGRLHTVGGRLVSAACPAFGASRHVANASLAAMEFSPQTRSAMNIRYSEEVISACRKAGFSIGSYERDLEPQDVKGAEGATTPWGVREAIRKAGMVPDVIYHRGDWGKEPMVLIFGPDPVAVAMKALRIAEGLKKSSPDLVKG
jgi:hydroxymethylpyrimidine/phosphomethylpyrimidine kinase